MELVIGSNEATRMDKKIKMKKKIEMEQVASRVAHCGQSISPWVVEWERGCPTGVRDHNAMAML